MYVCMPVTLRIGMLIFCTWCVLKVWQVHAAALLLSVDHSAQILDNEYDGFISMMDYRPYQG